MLFGFSASQDYAIHRARCFAGAGGLACRTAIMYTRRRQIRRKSARNMSRTSRRCWNWRWLAGAIGEGCTGDHAHRNRAGEGLFDAREQRDPYKLFHKMDRAQLQALNRL